MTGLGHSISQFRKRRLDRAQLLFVIIDVMQQLRLQRVNLQLMLLRDRLRVFCSSDALLLQCADFVRKELQLLDDEREGGIGHQ